MADRMNWREAGIQALEAELNADVAAAIKARDDAIRQAYADGASLRQIAAELGMAKSTVHVIVRDDGAAT